MKNLVFFGVAIAVLSTVAFFAAASKQTPELSPTQLVNIEALADVETLPEVEIICSGFNSTEPIKRCFIATYDEEKMFIDCKYNGSPQSLCQSF